MNARTIVNFCLMGLFVLAVLYVMNRWNSESWQSNDMYPFMAIIMLALFGGLFFVLVVLPRMGDAIGTIMYSSGEQVQQDESMKAAAKIATGDYEGAIEEYEKMIHNNPDDTYPVSEIAKLRAEKLEDPQGAIAFLMGHLQSREWTEEDAAFLMFRIVDIQMSQRIYEDAKDILEQIVGNFPGTRHSANAKHKINELEQIQFKELQAQRARTSAQA